MGGTELDISALGVRVSVELDQVDPPAAAELKTLWRDTAPRVGQSFTRSARLRAELRKPGGHIETASHPAADVTGVDFRSLSSDLSSRVTLAAINAQRGSLVMLHACGITDADGVVSAFVGPSGRGKTTLASALGRAYGYVSDETVAIDDDGAVHPYRKPLSVVERDVHATLKTQKNPTDLGLRPLPDAPLTIGTISLISRDPDHDGQPTVEDLDLVSALTDLVPELSYLPSLDLPLQRLARLIDLVGGVRRVRYRDAESVVGVIPELRARQSALQSWRALPFQPESASVGATQFGRVTPIDGIAIGDDYVLLHDSRVRVLAGLGPALWDALPVPADLETIIERVVAVVGPPPEGEATDLVREALHELTDAGVLETGRAL